VEEDLRYPIGQLIPPAEITAQQRTDFIHQIAELPALLRRAVEGLSPEKLSTPYRPGGWSVRQVVHHIADSHINGYVRTKLALTEELPVIKTYNQEDWVAVTDSRIPVEPSLRLLEGLHELWAGLLRSLSEDQWRRGFIHPELVDQGAKAQQDEAWRRGFLADSRGVITLEGLLPTYAWHGLHHVAHITRLRERMGW
jgi:hypothetical protein